MINGTTCDAANIAGCGNPPATISVGSDPVFGDANPFGIAVDQATDTIYTANIFNGEGPGTVSIINGATCNAHNTSGCDQTPATAPAGFGANGIAVDPTTNQVYATNIEDTSVTTINGAHLQRGQAERLRPAPGPERSSATTRSADQAVDPGSRTAYVADSGEHLHQRRSVRDAARAPTPRSGVPIRSRRRSTNQYARCGRRSYRRWPRPGWSRARLAHAADAVDSPFAGQPPREIAAVFANRRPPFCQRQMADAARF